MRTRNPMYKNVVKIGQILIRHERARRLHKICKAIGIKPYPWQRAYALGEQPRPEFRNGRATGKTTAIMLRLLMLDPSADYETPISLARIGVLHILSDDPDWLPEDRTRCHWYASEYRRLEHKCWYAGVKAPVIDLLKILGWGRPHEARRCNQRRADLVD